MDRAEHVWRVLAGGKTVEPDAVAEVLASACDVDDVAWHPTGFVVAKLEAFEHGVLRLHVWPDGDRVFGEPHWPVHDHVFSLESLVLTGSVVSREHEVVDDPAGTLQRWAVEYGQGQDSLLVPEGDPVAVRAGEPVTTRPGGTYGVAAGRFHTSSVPEGQLAATLVATRTTGRRRPFVLGPLGHEHSIAVRRVAAAPGRWRSWVERVAEAWARR